MAAGVVGHGAVGHGAVGHGVVGHGVVGHGAVGHGVVGHSAVGHGDNKIKRSSIPQQSTHNRETTIHKFFLIVISNV